MPSVLRDIVATLLGSMPEEIADEVVEGRQGRGVIGHRPIVAPMGVC